MKFISTALLACLLFSFTQCKEDDDNNTDLTAEIVGSYFNSNENATIVVNKIDNNTVSITLESPYWDIAFTNVEMNSATAFTMTEFTRTGEGCDGQEKISGTGTSSNDNISLFINIDGIGVSSPYDCQDLTYNVSASK